MTLNPLTDAPAQLGNPVLTTEDPARTAPHLYVHVPFCARRCSYCDFAIAVRRVVPVDEYLRALRGELRARFVDVAPWPVETVYFGGGTPSLLGPDGVTRMLELVRQWVLVRPETEVTLETNPEDVSAESVAAWRRAGVNRLSLGGQSFDDRVLSWMRRGHSGERVAEAVELARSGGIVNVSFDLIFAVPPELGRSWERDLEKTLTLGPPHVSLYGLTVEPATPLARLHARGVHAETPEEAYEAEFLAANRALAAEGYTHYEVSNFAHPGYESRHNASYWRGARYVGVGPSAHGYDGADRRWNVAPYAEWASTAGRGSDPIAGSEQLTEQNRIAEDVYLGLRTIGGLVLTEHESKRVAPWVDAGWARLDGRRLGLTALGWLRLDSLAADLTHARSRY